MKKADLLNSKLEENLEQTQKLLIQKEKEQKLSNDLVYLYKNKVNRFKYTSYL